MFGLIGFFVPIAEALFIGYAMAVAVYMALLFGITRMKGGLLVSESRATALYTALHAVAWCAAAFAGAYTCSHLSPIAPYGNVGFPVCLAIALAIVLFRGFRQLPGHMTVPALLLNVVAIATGTFAALSVLHAFAALQS